MRRFEISPRTRRGRARLRRFQARHEENPRAEKATWQWVVEMVILGVGVVLGWQTLSLGLTQFETANAGLSSSAAAAVYQQQQDIDNIFIEHPETDPYFSDGIAAPTTAQDRAKIRSIAFRLIDHFDHVLYQLNNGLFESNYDAWVHYIKRSFEKSPILCETLLNNNMEYGGTEEGSLWNDFAAPACAELGIKP